MLGAKERIEIRTFGQFLAHDYGLTCYCPGCRRVASRDIAELVRNGLGDRDPTECGPRCRLCGAVGQRHVRAPVPQDPDLGGAPKPRPYNVPRFRPRTS